MRGFVEDIEDITRHNSDFRRILYTGKNLQLVLMAIAPGDDIGEEIHPDRDQFFRIEKGKGEVTIDGRRTKIEADTAILVPASASAFVMCTVPSACSGGTVHMTKADALAVKEHFAGKTTE